MVAASPTDVHTQRNHTQIYTGDTNHPLQYDTYQQNWYIRVTAATSGDQNVNGTTGYKGIHYHLGNETFYANSLFTGSSYTQRIADNRSSRDRTYRIRYVVDNSTSLSREPINGYVFQVRNVPSGQTMVMYTTSMTYSRTRTEAISSRWYLLFDTIER